MLPSFASVKDGRCPKGMIHVDKLLLPSGKQRVQTNFYLHSKKGEKSQQALWEKQVGWLIMGRSCSFSNSTYNQLQLHLHPVAAYCNRHCCSITAVKLDCSEECCHDKHCEGLRKRAKQLSIPCKQLSLHHTVYIRK